jgi:AraC-like DNA-binding protein
MFVPALLFSLLNALVLFFAAGKKNTGNAYLGLLFLLIALRGFAMPNLEEIISPFFKLILCYHSFPSFFLFGPVFYFYFRYEIIGTRFHFKRDYLYLLPCFLAAINMIPYDVRSIDFKENLIHLAEKNDLINLQLDLLFLDSKWYFILGPIHTLVYLIFCLYLLRNKFKFDSQKLELNGFKLKEHWLKLLLTCFILFTLINLASLAYVQFTHQNLHQITLIVSSTIFIFININLYKYPQLIYGIKFYKSSNKIDLAVFRNKKKAIRMDDAFEVNFKNQIAQYQSTLDYLKPNFGYTDLIKDLNSSKYLVDNYFKNNLKIKFIDFINELRINHFKKSITQEDLKRFKLKEITLRFGFKNVASFKKAFQNSQIESFEEFKRNLKT